MEPQPTNSACACESNYFQTNMDCASQGLVPNVDNVCLYANSDSTPAFYVSPADIMSGRLEPAMVDRSTWPGPFVPINPY